ncbi:MAG: Na+:solute symporter [Bacteroidetes Order II. Incertae sedis bacterium]|jgi:solute:Na+ symporter, SSS family|nr:Na+:solute symporter [Bacteroidetes Order II. bacterium]MBT4601702.1 Na+:solute symporter [Bacteroidetes Order II. bacterium]MBT5248860.1 Na+:solute symporter [Bacteroidetes Order II. bacterium]MBT6424940.1 Na+:solute symporter [Bacteroidetes Order II. bacterium]
MQLATLDWVIMGAFFALSLIIGLSVSKRSGKTFKSFFLAEQSMPWWFLGISMVATTFSTDTPNLVTDIVRSSGVDGNWTWWAFLLTGMLTVFLYARLWRRSGVLTDVEFYEIRYSGPIAAFLRGFRAIYLGILFNIIIMASVTLAAIKIGSVMLGWSPVETVVVAASVTMVYSALGGLRGVVLTDMIQFAMAMVGSVWATIYVLNMPEVGGLSAMIEHVNVIPSLQFLPSFGSLSYDDIVPIFVIPLAVQWWAAYYPGAEPGGGGYLAQRMLSAKSEKEAAGATLLFNILHYAIRPWPWILIALASLIVFPDLASIAARFPHVDEQIIRNDLAYPAMLTYLPAGLLGLVVTSLAAAYMSTMSSQVNWGSSIIVNDLYNRFVNKEASEASQVWVGRLATVILMVIACTLALFLENALQVFNIILQIGAGTGLIFILRWFWWRVNAASELTAMIVSFVIAMVFTFTGGLGLESWAQLVAGVVVTTISWVTVAFLGPATDTEKLVSFYEKIRPGGRGWGPIMWHLNESSSEDGSDLPMALLAAVFGSITIYSALFATGYFLYGQTGAALSVAGIALLGGFGLWKIWPKLKFD